MPMSTGFTERLGVDLPAVAEHFGTPFYLYDAQGIDETCRAFNAAFSGLDCREYFAVKALPNPAILRLLASHGFGFDCSSLPEVALALAAGASSRDIFFTSNNTSIDELRAAIDADVFVNIDDESVLNKLIEADAVPAAVGFRINPGRLADGFDTSLFGHPDSAKFGIRPDRLLDVCATAVNHGVRSIGLHIMIAANFRTSEPTLYALDVLTQEATRLREKLDIDVTILNVGGGMGIPYRPDEQPLDLDELAGHLRQRLDQLPPEWRPKLCFENGRLITGPHGVLVTRVVNRMSKWRELVGVDVGATALLRSLVYSGVYHHITAPYAAADRTETVDVVGSLCTNIDRLAEQRELPVTREGDLLLIHDVGAHGHAMASTYNGRLRPKELLLHPDGSVELIRRAETEDDYFATLGFTPDTFSAVR
ncbi:diaminopimelate decarboxylase [Nocardia sp. NBC_01499]|uniref:diaminopimelate decarboxylase family protein n=1 Tax=Nocardia sp. NBC_01499 TaxID=2903597 RepID=UPI00386D5AFF